MERWQLSTKELSRYSVIENAIEGYLKADQAAEELHLSTRQIFRLKKRLRQEGIEGLIHGNRGRPSPRRTKKHLRNMIDYLYRGKYEGFSLSHYTEMLQGKRRGSSFSRNSKRHPS
jgi:transposase